MTHDYVLDARCTCSAAPAGPPPAPAPHSCPHAAARGWFINNVYTLFLLFDLFHIPNKF